MKNVTDNGALLALGLVGAVAAAGAVSRRGSRATTTQDVRGWLQARVDALPLPPGSNARVFYATLQSYEVDGEPQEALEYALGGVTNLNSDSTLYGFHDSDLHRIVTDALGLRGMDLGDIEDARVDRRRLRPGSSLEWSGTIYTDGDTLSRRVRA
jgi:hypothetical protein